MEKKKDKERSSEKAAVVDEVRPNKSWMQHPKKNAFLAAYSETGNITAACEVSDVGRATHYVWLDNDPEYAKAFQIAHEASIEKMELEARRRAIAGYEEPVYYQGAKVGTTRKYSDNLLMFMLKGAKPETYRENHVHQHTGANGGAIEINFNAKMLNKDD